MGVSQIRATILGVPKIRIIVFWGLYWGPPLLGNYHIPYSSPNLSWTIFDIRERGVVEFWRSRTNP